MALGDDGAVSPGPVRVGATVLVPDHGHTKRGDGGLLSRSVIHLAFGPRDYVAKTAAYTLSELDEICFVSASGGAVTITLPDAAGIHGKVYIIKKVDASVNAVTVDGAGADTIDGAATYALALQYASVTVCSDGTNWGVL